MLFLQPVVLLSTLIDLAQPLARLSPSRGEIPPEPVPSETQPLEAERIPADAPAAALLLLKGRDRVQVQHTVLPEAVQRVLGRGSATAAAATAATA